MQGSPLEETVCLIGVCRILRLECCDGAHLLLFSSIGPWAIANNRTHAESHLTNSKKGSCRGDNSMKLKYGSAPLLPVAAATLAGIFALAGCNSQSAHPDEKAAVTLAEQ
jgi:hypothetical protein